MSLEYDRLLAQTKARQIRMVMKFSTSFQLQRKSYIRLGVIEKGMGGIVGDHFIKMVAYQKELKRDATLLKKELHQIYENHPLYEWVEATRGLSTSVFLLDALLAVSMGEYATVSGLWKSCGLHPDGAQPRKGEMRGYDPFKKSLALVYIGEPMMKARGPYRYVYDERKARTLSLHPEPEDTGRLSKEGKPIIAYTPAHIANDGMRVMTKAILRDAWRVGNGKPPLVQPTLRSTTIVETAEPVEVS